MGGEASRLTLQSRIIYFDFVDVVVVEALKNLNDLVTHHKALVEEERKSNPPGNPSAASLRIFV